MQKNYNNDYSPIVKSIFCDRLIINKEHYRLKFRKMQADIFLKNNIILYEVQGQMCS